MNDQSIKIDDLIIDPKYIMAINLNARIYSYKDGKHYLGVMLIMSAVDGELSTMSDGVGSWEPYTIEYVNAQAEALRPWLAAMFPCEGCSIRLPAEQTINTICRQCDKSLDPGSGDFCSPECNIQWRSERQFVDTGVSSFLDMTPSLEADGMITVYEILSGDVVAEYEGLEIHERLSNVRSAGKVSCQLDTCNVSVPRNGYFCSDECAELFEEQIPF